jgi:hypothetical protein
LRRNEIAPGIRRDVKVDDKQTRRDRDTVRNRLPRFSRIARTDLLYMACTRHMGETSEVLGPTDAPM